MGSTLLRILRQPFYLALSLLSTFSIFVLVLWIPNANLFQYAIPGKEFSFALKIKIFESILVNFTLFSGLMSAFLAILLGLNIAVLTFYFRNKVAVFRAQHTATSFLGIFFGILGLGCAACGSFILMNILPFLGGWALLSILPFHGLELSVLGVTLLAISLVLTLKEIQNPKVCKLEALT